MGDWSSEKDDEGSEKDISYKSCAHTKAERLFKVMQFDFIFIFEVIFECGLKKILSKANIQSFVIKPFRNIEICAICSSSIY